MYTLNCLSLFLFLWSLTSCTFRIAAYSLHMWSIVYCTLQMTEFQSQGGNVLEHYLVKQLIQWFNLLCKVYISDYLNLFIDRELTTLKHFNHLSALTVGRATLSWNLSPSNSHSVILVLLLWFTYSACLFYINLYHI